MTQLEFAREFLRVSQDIARWVRTQLLNGVTEELSWVMPPDIGREYLRQIRVMLDEFEGRL